MLAVEAAVQGEGLQGRAAEELQKVLRRERECLLCHVMQQRNKSRCFVTGLPGVDERLHRLQGDHPRRAEADLLGKGLQSVGDGQEHDPDQHRHQLHAAR